MSDLDTIVELENFSYIQTLQKNQLYTLFGVIYKCAESSKNSTAKCGIRLCRCHKITSWSDPELLVQQFCAKCKQSDSISSSIRTQIMKSMTKEQKQNLNRKRFIIENEKLKNLTYNKWFDDCSRLNLNIESDEKWSKIVNFFRYRISTHGRIMNVISGKILRPELDRHEYETVQLVNDLNERKHVFVHRLVAQTFIPNPKCKSEVNHLAEKNDNQVWNLEWATPSENSIHAVKYKRTQRQAKIIITDNNSNITQIYYTFKQACQGINICRLTLLKKSQNKNYSWIVDRSWITDVATVEYENEVWKKLSDSVFKELHQFLGYQISNYGRIKGVKGKLMKPVKRINLAPINKKFELHRLVIMAFNIVPDRLDQIYVDHIDSNPHNNELSNLRWVTHKENMQNENTKQKIKTTRLKLKEKIQ